MKVQYTPATPSLDLVSSDHEESLEMILPSSPKMRQIVADYEAAHSIKLSDEPDPIAKQKYH